MLYDRLYVCTVLVFSMPKASYFIASHILVRSEEEYYFIWKTSNNSNSQRLMVKEIDKKDKK